MHLVEAGKNLIYICDFLGHESIETTQVYAKANPEARRKALETNGHDDEYACHAGLERRP